VTKLCVIDVISETRLVRFRFCAGKTHLGAALHAIWLDVETLEIVGWHARTPQLEFCQPASYGSAILAATNYKLFCTGWTPSARDDRTI
jgi:hypothetical protein